MIHLPTRTGETAMTAWSPLVVCGEGSNLAAQEEIHRTREQLERVLALCPAVIYSLKVEEGPVTLASVTGNVRHILGFEVVEACRPGWWPGQIHPDDRDDVMAGLPALLKQGHRTCEYRLLNKDGVYRWIRDVQVVVRDPGRQPADVAGSWTDVTERKQVEEQLRQAQKMEAIGRLAGGLAHDFNNLLTVVTGYASLLLADEGCASRTAELAEILKAGERATNLTSQLLAFSRKQAVNLRALDINQITIGVAKMLRRLIGEDIALRMDLAPGLPSVRADAGMLEQILLNLAVNARDAMPKGGELTIATKVVAVDAAYSERIQQARPGRFVRLSMRDTGCGMTPETLSRIFEPFFTTKEDGRGTGLGLATVRAAVQQHHGWVEVESRQGDGANFKVFLPTARKPAGHTAVETERAVAPGSGETILLVEDDDPLRSLAATVLRKSGYRVIEAATGDDALAIWEQHGPDISLLLTDLVMPGSLNGRELSERLRRLQPALKTVYSSGYNTPEASGFEDAIHFLRKPYSPHLLAEAVRRALHDNNEAGA